MVSSNSVMYKIHQNLHRTRCNAHILEIIQHIQISYVQLKGFLDANVNSSDYMEEWQAYW